MEKYSLGIVQSHATQFDGPLFRRLASSPDINLTVYYTQPEALQPSYDHELQHRSGWDHDISSGYSYCLFPTRCWRQFYFAKKLVTSGHDLVIVAGYNSLSALLVTLLGKLYRIPVGLRSDSVLLYRTRQNWRWKIKDLVLPQLYKLYSTGHPTGSLASSYMEHYGFSSQALFLFPYAADNEYLHNLFSHAAPQRDKLREELGIKPEDFVILGVLKFNAREDPLTLLRAYDQVYRTYSNVHLLMVGDGELFESMREYIVQKNLGKAHLPGYVAYSQLPNYFAIADVFVHPARREPWGGSVNEAMVCGLPVVVADTVGAGADLVEEGKTGFGFKAGHPESLAEVLNRLVSRPEFCQYLATNAVERIGYWTHETTYNHLINSLKYIRAQRDS